MRGKMTLRCQCGKSFICTRLRTDSPRKCPFCGALVPTGCEVKTAQPRMGVSEEDDIDVDLIPSPDINPRANELVTTAGIIWIMAGLITLVNGAIDLIRKFQ
jgi:hypothetical protein